MWKNTLLKILFRTVLFFAIFTGTALIVNVWDNRGSDRAYVELSGPSLPVVYTFYGETKLAGIPAYRQDMDPSLIRNSILPVGEEKEVCFAIDGKGSSIGGVSYQLRDATGETLIEEGDLEIAEVKQHYSFCRTKLRMDMKKNQPYIFEVLLDYKGTELRFYTRVVRLEKEYVASYLEAADSFHNLLLSEKSSVQKEEIETYIDENVPAEYDRNDLGAVSLFSTYEALTWGDMKPEISTDRERALTEIYEDGGTVVLRYSASTMDEETQEIRVYEVEEHIVLEYVQEQAGARVTDYFRRVKRQFSAQQFDRKINGIRVGLQDELMVYRTDEDNQHLVFAMNGGVWYYDYNASTIVRMYGSETTGSPFSDQEDYVILAVDDKQVYFAVYGRISCGPHEGENGILVERFDEEERTLVECVFISTNLSYEWMSAETGKLLFLDQTKGVLYYLLNESLRSVSLEDGKEEVLAEGLSVPEVLVSQDHSVIAFPTDSGKKPGAEMLSLWDLANGSKIEIKEKGQMQALTFIGDDFVYGVANASDASYAADGQASLLYSSLKIVKRNGKEKKVYQRSGMVLSEVKFLNNTIYLKRQYKSPESGGYSEATPDYITYKIEDMDDRTLLAKEEGENGYALVFPDYIYMTAVPETLIAKEDTEEGIRVTVRGRADNRYGYLFRAGHLEDLSERTGITVKKAVDTRGYVVMADGRTLYRRRAGVPYLTVADQVEYQEVAEGDDGYAACLTMSLKMAGAEASYETVQRELSDNERNWDRTFDKLANGAATGLNLSGANLDTAVLFLGDGIPFATALGDRYVFVVSFNANAIRYYDPVLKSEVRLDRSVFREKVEDSGNEFFLYIK